MLELQKNALVMNEGVVTMRGWMDGVIPRENKTKREVTQKGVQTGAALAGRSPVEEQAKSSEQAPMESIKEGVCVRMMVVQNESNAENG